MASPTVIGTPVWNSAGTWSNVTTSVTVPNTGQNRALIAILWSSGGNDTAYDADGSVVYNGTETMTKIVSITGVRMGGGIMFYLANPTTGTHNIVATIKSALGNRNLTCIAFTLQDCLQNSATVVDVTGTNDTASATSLAKSVTTTVDSDLVLSWIFTGAGTSLLTAGQTELLTPETIPGGDPLLEGAEYAAKDPAGAQNMTWSWTTAGAAEMFVAALKYVAPSPVTDTPFARNLILTGVGK